MVKFMTRQNQLFFLIVLSGFTAMSQYAIQGRLASAHNPLTDLPDWFWTAELVFWTARALIEAWLGVYLFVTVTPKWDQKILITFWEVVVLGLIFFTVGGAFWALGYVKNSKDVLSAMLQSMGEPNYTYWTYSIGGYTAVMMAAAGTAYRVQPTDNGTHTVDASQLQRYEVELRRLEGDATQARGEAAQAQLVIERLQGEIASALAQRNEAQAQRDEAHKQVAFALADVAWMCELEETTQARLLFLASWRNGLTPKFVSDVLGIAPSTSSRAKATMDQAVDAILAKREAEKESKG